MLALRASHDAESDYCLSALRAAPRRIAGEVISACSAAAWQTRMTPEPEQGKSQQHRCERRHPEWHEQIPHARVAGSNQFRQPGREEHGRRGFKGPEPAWRAHVPPERNRATANPGGHTTAIDMSCIETADEPEEQEGKKGTKRHQTQRPARSSNHRGAPGANVGDDLRRFMSIQAWTTTRFLMRRHPTR